MKSIKIKGLLCFLAIFFCVTSLSTAFAAETVTISGTITDMSTYPNMIAIDDGGVITEVYGIRLGYLARQYNVVIETGMAVSVEAYENLCYDGTIRLKATSITVDDLTIDIGRTGSGQGGRGSGQGRGGSGQGNGGSGQGRGGSGQKAFNQ